MPRWHAASLLPLILACATVASALSVPRTVVTPRDPSPLLLGAARVAHIQSLHAAQADPAAHFNAWVLRHAKAYAGDAVEMASRLAIWADNLAYSIEYNAQRKTHWIGMNHLADLTQAEYRTQLLGFDNAARLARPARPVTAFLHGAVDEDALPTAIDWRTQKAVSEVKNQAQCGSCWAFSTTGAVEGANVVYGNPLVSLSEQLLVDCDTEQDQGCRGGLMDFAYQFIIDNGGLDTEEDYPYTAADGVCDIARENRKVVSIDSFEDVPVNDERALKKAVSRQPVAVAIEADQRSFQLYSGGVYDDEEGCGTQLDHGVLAAGYGVDPVGGPFWLIKNSWGGDWGDHGYIRMKMNADAPEGMCGIAMSASYPIKTTPNPAPSPPTPPTPSPGPGPTPGPDSPIVCDDSAECPAGTTCCCAQPLFGMCFSWGCCPLIDATCCDDNEHCCPSNLPVCDTDAGRCLPEAGLGYGAGAGVPWATKLPATQTGGSVLSTVFGRRTGAGKKKAAATVVV